MISDNMQCITITEAQATDVKAITQLFYDTICTVNAKDYPKDEIDDWASWHKDTEKWLKSIKEQYFIVAKLNHKVIGFSSLTENGYLDLMYVHKDFQRQGVAAKLLMHIEQKAILQQNDLIYSDVSITAKGFFEKYGFKVERRQLKQSKKKALINFRMIKLIPGVKSVQH